MAADGRCGPPCTIVFDEDYGKFRPWAEVSFPGRIRPEELTDAAVEKIFDSEKDNADNAAIAGRTLCRGEYRPGK